MTHTLFIFFFLSITINKIGHSTYFDSKFYLAVFAVAASLSVLTASVKLLKNRISEIFFLVFVIPMLLIVLILRLDFELLEYFLSGIILAAAISFVSSRLNFLTKDGAIASFLIGSILFGIGSIKWSVPILTFFILSSMISNLRRNYNSDVDSVFEKSSKRDQMQVLANGGVSCILLLLYKMNSIELYYFVYLGCMAVVCSDTLATEIGTMKVTSTYNILNFKPVKQGTSGGISLIGTFGALLGAISIALTGVYWYNNNILFYFVLVIFAGLAGNLIDSVLGSTVQAQFRCGICGKTTEKRVHCGKITTLVSGYKWINNDLVNFVSSASGGLVLIIVYKLFLK